METRPRGYGSGILHKMESIFFLHISSFQYYWENTGQNLTGEHQMCGYNTKLANTIVVPSANKIEKRYDNTRSQQKLTAISNPAWKDTSTSWKIKPYSELDP